MKKAIFAIATLAVIALPVFAAVESGLKPGDRVTPFHPDHVSGPLAGTTNCFPCTFQQRPMVQVWVHGDDHENVHKMIEDMAGNMTAHKDKEFKALFVFVADNAEQKAALKKELATGCGDAKEGSECMCKDVGLAVIDKDNEALKNYKINLDNSVKNTVIVYRNWKVEKTLVNVKMDEKGCNELCSAVASITK